MERKKLVIATIVSMMILLTMFSSLNLTKAAIDPPAWYTVTNGVLDSDYYMLYPFEPNSVSYGFSKFGELIGIPPGADQSVQANWVGMMYGGRDPFAPADTIPMPSWINGWYMSVEYIDPAVTGVAKDRHLFAFAMFADGYAAGGDWQSVTSPAGAPHGGRKTNGVVQTETMKILYDGPRKFVAQSISHIFDTDGTVSWPVVDLTITMIFDKVKKETILFKDVKITIPKMHIFGKLNVQLSNREEYDLGPSPGYASYAHFYEERGNTSYTPDWHMAKNLVKDHIEHQVGNGSTTVFNLSVPGGRPLSTDFMKVYIGGVFQDPSISPAPYTVNYGAKTVNFTTAPASLSDVKFFYKYIFKAEDISEVPTWAHKYDIAQVISSDGLFVAWTAMWPPVSSYTVDGILRFLTPLFDIAEADMSSEPKQSPLIIGQWDFALDHATLPMFRGVEVKGIANRHNADDAQYGGYDIIDTEAHYQLDEVFLPWDLKSAVEKDENRWVQFHNVTTSEWQAAQLGYPLYISLEHRPVLYASWWEQYSSFSERVIWDGTLQYPYRQLSTIGFDYSYELLVESTGFGGIYVYPTMVPAVGTQIKIIYSTDTMYSQPGFTITGMQVFNGTTSDQTMQNFTLSPSKSWLDNLNVHHSITTEDFSGWFQNVTNQAFPTNQNLTWTYDGTLEWGVEPFKVFKEDTAYLEIGNDNFETVNVTATQNSTYVLQMKLDYLEINWAIYGPQGPLFTDLKDVHFYGWDNDVKYSVTVAYSNATMNFTATGTLQFVNDDVSAPLYTEKIPGRYEMFNVGRDAQSIDSAGVAEVTAAFKNKQVEIGIGAADMYNPITTLQMPWIMSKFGTGNTRADYKDSLYRAALRDDWCTTWQITSANLIGEGGPNANLLAYYANDFTDAFFGLSQFTSYTPWVNKIIPLSCWNGTKGGYASTTTTGYAVITTYQDINGTAMFLVWGYDGRDTYYASQWFHEDLIQEFQNFPDHATSIVLKISYKSYPEGYKPIGFKVVEVLGTISETLVEGVKGGIHDP